MNLLIHSKYLFLVLLLTQCKSIASLGNIEITEEENLNKIKINQHKINSTDAGNLTPVININGDSLQVTAYDFSKGLKVGFAQNIICEGSEIYCAVSLWVTTTNSSHLIVMSNMRLDSSLESNDYLESIGTVEVYHKHTGKLIKDLTFLRHKSNQDFIKYGVSTRTYIPKDNLVLVCSENESLEFMFFNRKDYSLLNSDSLLLLFNKIDHSITVGKNNCIQSKYLPSQAVLRYLLPW